MSDRNPYLGWLLVLIAAVIFLPLYHNADGQQAGPELPALEPSPQRTSEAGALPDDPLQACARKALRGDFGKLAEWQRVGFSRLLENGARKRVAWITCYWTGEPGVNSTTASGRRVERGRTAAMLEPRDGMPYGTFVLVSLPAGYQLRQVWDTGSRRNRGRAEGKGAQTWIDLYMPGRIGATHIRPIWIERY